MLLLLVGVKDPQCPASEAARAEDVPVAPAKIYDWKVAGPHMRTAAAISPAVAGPVRTRKMHQLLKTFFCSQFFLGGGNNSCGALQVARRALQMEGCTGE